MSLIEHCEHHYRPDLCPHCLRAEVENLRDELRDRGPGWLEADRLRQQLEGAVARGDWFRQAWANANGCSVEEAERAYETLGDITAQRGQ